MDPENFLVAAGSLTHYAKILCMANNTGVACNHGHFDYNGQKSYHLPTTCLNYANVGQRESKKGMFVRVVKTSTHRDVILSPFVMEKASENLNEERERQRLREESSSQSTTPHVLGSAVLVVLIWKVLLKPILCMLRTRRPEYALPRNSPRIKEITMILLVPSAGLKLVTVISLMASLQSLLIFQRQNFLKDLIYEIHLSKDVMIDNFNLVICCCQIRFEKQE